ncbi:MAG: SH3 domain-containing protein [Campylobacter sp.]|nr:SH3 domain-containing protein [Campylobacter sp.]
MRNFLYALLILFLVGCSQKTSEIHSSNTTLKPDLKQDAAVLQSIEPNDASKKDEFMNYYFAPWEGVKYSPQKETFWGLNYAKGVYYGDDKRRYSSEFLEALIKNTDINSYKKLSKNAITIANTELRNLPTYEPFFKDPNNPNSGYPFDELSNSILAINQPIFVSHLSLDKEWAFVRSDTVWGWVNARDIAFTTLSQELEFKNSNFIVILRDQSDLLSLDDEFISNARSGNLLKFTAFDDEFYYGEILTKTGKIFYKIPKTDARVWPAILNDENIQEIISSQLFQPYGWGGWGFYRDCSLFTKDFLAAFGIWLPRNSKAQANFGKTINLRGLSSDQKLEVIKNQGIPYKSVIYLPGHVMLYTGIVDGEVSVTHSIWGLKTKDGGRALIASTAITTLEVGKDNSNIDKSRLLLNRASLMSVF